MATPLPLIPTRAAKGQGLQRLFQVGRLLWRTSRSKRALLWILYLLLQFQTQDRYVLSWRLEMFAHSCHSDVVATVGKAWYLWCIFLGFCCTYLQTCPLNKYAGY